MRVLQDHEVKAEIATDEVTIIDFFAPWCGPCKSMEPYLEALSSDVKVVKVDIDQSPETAANYGIRSVPTLIAFKKGEMLDVRVGAQSESSLRKWSADLADM